ncbi:hypothetical protein [Streptomyces sp. NPDC001678]|uniref:hypothetical protein n=1 Tax=Streptomyces sp. NPDC001678 TaxID=3364599 RepID=UPI00368EDE05
MLEPGEIPTFTGNLGELEKDAAGLKSDASAIRSTGGDIHSKFQGLSAFYHAPEAEALFATTVPVRDKAKGFGDKLEKVSSALTEYAAEVRPLADKLDALKREAESFVSSVKGDKDWAYDKKKTDHQKRIRSDIDETVGAFNEAERRAANKITALVNGTTFVADDGSHKDNMYGFKADDLKHAKVPWGEPEEQRHHAYEIGYWVKSFVWDGLIVDGVWGTIKGLGTLVGFGGWDAFKNAWKGLGMLAVGVAVYSSPIGRAIPDSMLPKFVQDSKKVAREAGKAMLAWDEWKKNPARAAGAVTFNVLTSITGAGNVAKAGTVGKVVNVAGKVGKVIDPMTYIGKGIGKGLGALNISVPKVSDLMAGLKNTLGGNKVVPANFALPHDLSVAAPHTPNVAAPHTPNVAAPHTPNVTSVLPDKSVKFPDGTILHENGTMVSPKGAPHQNPIPVELSAADRAAHQQIAASTSTSTPSHAGTHAEQPVLVHATGGSADNAAHVGGIADNAAARGAGHAGETSLPSLGGRGGDNVAAHTGGHTAESTAHAGGSHAPTSAHVGGGSADAASHVGGGRGVDSAAHAGSHGFVENSAAHAGGRGAETSLPSAGRSAEHGAGHAGGGSSQPPHAGGPHGPSEHGSPNASAHPSHDTPASGTGGHNAEGHGAHGNDGTPHGNGPARHGDDASAPHHSGHDEPHSGSHGSDGPHQADDAAHHADDASAPHGDGHADHGHGATADAQHAGTDGSHDGQAKPTPKPSTPEVVAEQVRKANENPEWFKKYYREGDGHRLDVDARDENGHLLPILRRDNKNSPWFSEYPPAEPPDYLLAKPIEGDPATVHNPDHARELEEAAERRQKSLDELTKAENAWKEADEAYKANKTDELKAELDQAAADKSAAHAEKTDATEDFGEKAAEYHAIPDHYQGAKRLDGGERGNNRFDQIWQTEDGRYVVVEAKSSPDTKLGDRWSSGPKKIRVMQGTREYFQTILDQMERRGEDELAEALEKARKSGNLDYVLVKGNPNGSEYAGYIMNRFDISPKPAT